MFIPVPRVFLHAQLLNASAAATVALMLSGAVSMTVVWICAGCVWLGVVAMAVDVYRQKPEQVVVRHDGNS